MFKWNQCWQNWWIHLLEVDEHSIMQIIPLLGSSALRMILIVLNLKPNHIWAHSLNRTPFSPLPFPQCCFPAPLGPLIVGGGLHSLFLEILWEHSWDHSSQSFSHFPINRMKPGRRAGWDSTTGTCLLLTNKEHSCYLTFLHCGYYVWLADSYRWWGWKISPFTSRVYHRLQIHSWESWGDILTIIIPQGLCQGWTTLTWSLDSKHPVQ